MTAPIPDLTRLLPFVGGLGKAILQELIEDMQVVEQQMRAHAKLGDLVLTHAADGRLVAITRQDSEGRILSVLWEEPAQPASGHH